MFPKDHLQTSISVKSEVEEKEPSSKKQVKVCWEWDRFKRCSRLAKCTYLHPSPTSSPNISLTKTPSSSLLMDPPSYYPQVSQEFSRGQKHVQVALKMGVDGKMLSEGSQIPNNVMSAEGFKSSNPREGEIIARSVKHEFPSGRLISIGRELETKKKSRRGKYPSDRELNLPINGQVDRAQMVANDGNLDKNWHVPQKIKNLQSAIGNLLEGKNLQQMEGELPYRKAIENNLPRIEGKGKGKVEVDGFKGSEKVLTTEKRQQTNEKAGGPFYEQGQMSESVFERMEAEEESSEMALRQLEEGIRKRLRAVKDQEVNLKKAFETLKKERIEVDASRQHSNWMREEASLKEANVLAKAAEVELLKGATEKTNAELSIQLAVCQRKVRKLNIAESSLRVKEKAFAERLQVLESKEKQLEERESQMQQVLNQRRKETQQSPPDHQDLEARDLRGVSVKLEVMAPNIEKEGSHNESEEARSLSPHKEVAKEANNEPSIISASEQRQNIPDETSLLDGKVAFETDAGQLIEETEDLSHATKINTSNNVIPLYMNQASFRDYCDKDKTKAGLAQKREENLEESLHGKNPQVQEEMRINDPGNKDISEPDLCQQNPKAGSSKRRKRRGRRAGKTKSVEDILKQDAPELLARLQEKGLLEVFESIDRMSLDEEEGSSCEDNGEKSACPGEFVDLQGVLRRLFGSVQDAGRGGGNKNQLGSSSGGQNDGLLSGGNRPRYSIESLAAILEQCTAVKRYGWPALWGWSRKCKSFVFVFDRHNRIVLEWPEYPNATYFFELESGIEAIWQVNRLLAVMASPNVRKNAVLENKSLEMGGKVVTKQEELLLQFYGWTSNSGLGSLLNFRDRLFHDYRTSDDDQAFQVAISEWRTKVGKKLRDGISEGRRTREPPEAYRLWESRQSKEDKAET